MAAPFTPSVTVEAAFGNGPTDGFLTWADLSQYHAREVTVSRGRPSEFDRFKPGSCSFELVDDTGRDLDPTNLSGPYVDTFTTTAFPLYVGAFNTEVGTSLGTDNPVTLPADVETGELLLAYVTVDLNGGATGVSLGSGSAVWTELFDDANGTAVRHACYARISTGSDALVLTGAAQDYVVEIIRVARHGCATTADIQVGTTATGTSGTPNPPNLAAGSTKKWLWVAMAGVDYTTGITLDTFPSGFTTIDTEVSAVSTSSVALFWSYKHDEVSSLNPTNWGIDASRAWVANTVAVPPASTSVDRTQIVPGTPVRVVASLAAAETVFDDPATGPGLHSGWRVEQGAVTGAVSGSYPLPTGTVMTGPAFNFDEDGSFQFGTAARGVIPNHDVRVVCGNGNYFGYNLTGTTLTYQVHFGGSTADDTVAWNDTTMRYLRMRVDGEDLVWERSADASSWTTIDTYTRNSDFTDIDWSYGYLYVANSGTTTPSLDDFKVKVSHFTRFTGHIDTWEYSPLPGNRGAVARVQATDAFGELAQRAIPNVWQSTVRDLSPRVWYQLSETERGGVAYDSSGNGLNGQYPLNGVEQGAPPPTPLIGAAGVRFPPKNTRTGIVVPAAARITSAPYSWSAWVQATERFPDSAATPFDNLGGMVVFTQAQESSDGNRLLVAVQARSGTIDDSDPNNPVIVDWDVLVYATGSWGSSIATYRATIEDTLPHMITWTVSGVGGLGMYIDGVPPVTEQTFAGFAGSQIGVYIGQDIPAVGVPNGYSFPGVVDEVMWFDTELSASDVADLYEAGTAPWVGDTTGERVDRVLDLVDWPPGLRRVDNGETTLAAATNLGGSVLSYLQAVERTEGARMFVGPHGEIVFQDASRAASRTTSPVLFDDAGNGVDILGAGFRATVDTGFLFTSASVTRDGGDAQVYTDTTAADRYGDLVWSESVLARTDLEAYLRGVGVVERYKDPAPRLGGWRAAPEKSAADWADVLNIRLGDTARVQFTLLNTGDTYDEYVDVSSVTETISGGAWEFEFQGTPQHPGIGTFLEWDGTTTATGWDLSVWR